MHSRFTIKDFFLFSLIILLIIIVALAMKQYDRQYQLVRDLDQQGRDQLRELVAIHNALDRGGSFSGATTQTPSSVAEAFPDLTKLRADGKYNQGDWFVMNLMTTVAKITPFISTDLYSQIIDARVLESLAYRDPQTLNYLPMLATSWQTSADGLTITFQIRHGVTFSDGSPMTADDVVYSYNLFMDPKTDCPAFRQQFDQVESCTKTNDYEVVFKFKQPFFNSFDNAATAIQVISKQFYSHYTIDQFNNSLGLLLGTGPYRLASPTDWKPGPGKIELLRNDRYWGVSPSFDRLVFLQIESDATDLVTFTNGDEDVISLHPQQYQLLLKRQDVMDRSQQFIYDSPLAPYYYIAWNQKHNGQPTIFADKRVRQAMTMLTDREGICKNIFLGYAYPAAGPYNKLSKQNDPTLADWTYDPDKAKALLKEAGFEDRGKGILEKADGTQLSFKLSYPSKNETTQRMLQYIQDGYSRAGVHAELDPLDWTIIEQRLKTRNFDAISLGWSAGGMEDDIYQMFHSSQMAGDGDDFMSYQNPALDQAIEQARRTMDEDARMNYWHKCQLILHDDQPYTFLLSPKSLRLFDKRIANVHLAKTGSNVVLNWAMPIPWYVPGALQKYK